MRAYIAGQGVPPPTLFPMIRARLVGYNGRAVTGADFAGRGDQAKRLAEREFNLSMADAVGDDNTVVAGRMWPPRKLAKPVENRVKQAEAQHFTSDCVMAGAHIAHGLGDGASAEHPVSLLRKAYGI